MLVLASWDGWGDTVRMPCAAMVVKGRMVAPGGIMVE
jgi:hypothetical protein